MSPKEGARHRESIGLVQRLFRVTLEIETPSAETDLFEMEVMDSLTSGELAVPLEQAYGITISRQNLELGDFRTMGGIGAFAVWQNNGQHGPDQTVRH